jgi:tetratricopeptide (TPR) repeat protein
VHVAEKARADRVRRLEEALGQRLQVAIVAIDVLMSELADGDARKDLWDKLHVAAVRDGQESEVADAYAKCASGPRMKRLTPEAQADLLMHAADFFAGVRGDPAGAEDYLRRVLTLVPGHAEAYVRLERRLEQLLDARRILELYASVAAAPPKPVTVLATQAFNRVLQLTAKDALPDDACRQLIVLVPTTPRLLEVLEAHCRATKRHGLACALFEQALLDETAPATTITQRRHRLVELYMGDDGSRALAIGHVEALLNADPNDAVAFKSAERLLSVADVTSRAAAALLAARRARG